MRLGLGLDLPTAAIRGGGIYFAPAGLGWPSTVNGKSVPQAFVKVGNDWQVYTGFDPKTLVNDAIWTNAPFYVDGTKANNNGDGLSEANAKRDISAAITAGNATGAPYRVLVKAGSYRVSTSINGSSTPVVPSQPCALVGYDGRVVHEARDLLAGWADDGTGNNTYVVTKSGVRRVFDIATPNAYGDFSELTKVADAAAVRASTTGAWAQVSTSLYAKRAGGGVVSDSTVRAYLSSPAAEFLTGANDLYIENFDFYGGQLGSLYIATQTGARNIVLINNSYKYSGGDANLNDALRIERVNGIVYVEGGITAAAAKDGMNFHASAGSPTDMYVMTLNCLSRDNGRFTSTSVNAFTTHEDVVGWDIGGDYGTSGPGPTAHCVDTTKQYYLGTTIDADADSGATPTAVQASDTSEQWLDRCAITSTTRSLYAQTGATIRLRGNTITGTQDDDSGAGTIEGF